MDSRSEPSETASPAFEVAMSEDFYFKTFGMEFGPVTLAEILRMIDSESLMSGDSIRFSNDPWIDVALFVHPSTPETSGTSKNDPSAVRTSASPQPQPLHPPRPRNIPETSPKPDEANWLYQTETGTYGPWTTAQFMDKVTRGIVTPQTMVRLVGDPCLMKAGDISGLEFPEVSGKTVPAEPALIPPEVAVTPRLREENSDVRQAELENARRRQAESRIVDLRSTGSDYESRFRQSRFSSERPSILVSLSSGVVSLLGSKTLWGVTLLAILIVLAVVLPSTIMSQRKAFEQLSRIYREFSKLRENRVDSGVWNEFHKKAVGELADLTPFLEKHARGRDPVSISLLRVARDDFPKLFKARSLKSSEIDDEIQAHLWVAETRFPRTAGFHVKLDLLTTIIIALDLLGISIAAVILGMRWWNRQSAAN